MPVIRPAAAWTGAALGLLGLLLVASSGFGVVWDETLYFDYTDSVRRWVAAGRPFDDAALREAFEYSPYHNPHPPLFKILAAATARALPFPLGYRLPYLAFCAMGLAAAGAALALRFGRGPALAAIACAALAPRVVGELVVAVSDGVVAVTWLALPVLLWAAEGETDPRRRRVLQLAYVLVQVGGAGAKITGLLAAVPLAATCLLLRRPRSLGLVAGAAALGLVSAALWSPAHWSAPGTSVLEMLLYPLRRGEIPISVYYLGQLYPTGLRVPWHHFTVMILGTLPAALLLGLPGLALRPRAQGLAGALAAPVLFWLVLGHLPGVPRHGGVRQFVGFLPLLGLLAWLGWEALLEKAVAARVLVHAGTVRLARFFPATWLLVGLLQAHPYELSWYGPVVGGVAGAERRGLELSYFLDPVRQALGIVNQHAAPGATVVLRPDWPDLLLRYQGEGLLRPDLRVSEHMAEADVVVVVRYRAVVSDAQWAAVPAVAEVRQDGVGLVKVMAVDRAP